MDCVCVQLSSVNSFTANEEQRCFSTIEKLTEFWLHGLGHARPHSPRFSEKEIRC
jgi:hypothetical protein